MDTVDLTTLRQHLGDVMGRVQYGRQQITVTRRGDPIAVISPLNTDDTSVSATDKEDDINNDEC